MQTFNEVDIHLSLDGNMYSATVGNNLQEGMAFFAGSPIDALVGLAKEMGWTK